MKIPGIDSSNRLFIVLVSAVLLALYIFSIGRYFTLPPSDSMSRGFSVGVTETAGSGNERAALLTMPSPENNSIFLAAVDGKETRLIEIDYLGEIQRDFNIELDISEASQLSGYAGVDGKIHLFVNQRTLESYVIDIGEKTWQGEVLMDEARSFRSDGGYLVIRKTNALVGYNSIENVLTEPLVSGNIKYYDFDADKGNFTIVSIVDKDLGKYDLLMTTGKQGFEDAQTISILSNSADPIYRKLHDIRTAGNVVSLLFVMRDNRYGLNYITIEERARDTGMLINSYQVHVPIQNSRYTLLESPKGTASFLQQSRNSYGYNLESCRIYEGGEAVFSDMTKTRPYSLESLIFNTGDWNALVFSDLEGESRTIYYASDRPELMESSSRLRAGDVKSIAGAVVTNIIVASFLGAIYMLSISIIPFGIVIALSRRKTGSRLRNLVITGSSALINTALKLAVVYYFIHETGSYGFRAPLIGGEPAIYAVLIILSVISFTLIIRPAKLPSARGKSVSGLFFQFLAIDNIHFTLVFIVYNVTTLMMGKF